MDKSILEKTTFATPVELEKQEALTESRIKFLKETYNHSLTSRSKENFIDVMNWVVENFSKHLGHGAEPAVTKYVHNRIIIDGQFLHYCELNKVKVECLYQDSIVSWQSTNGFEKFFAQGVFKIKVGDLTFLHAALYHKGNQYEDEVSFFVVVPDNNYESYIKFRNDFDDWLLLRDRSNLQIHVIDGEDIPYDKEASWDDIFLPEEMKKDIKLSVESFLLSKDFYKENKIPWKRGILFFGSPGCGKTSCIKAIIANYNFKAVTIPAHAGDEVVREAFSYAEEQSPALLYFEDLDSLLEHINISGFLNLLDGVSAKNGLLVIATANDISKLKDNIKQRPSRFDRKWEIPLPNQQMCVSYLKKWYKKSLTDKKIKELSEHAVKCKFSYAYLKELYISSVFNGLAENRKAPNVDDVSLALKQLMQEKRLSAGGKISIGIDKYLESEEVLPKKSKKK